MTAAPPKAAVIGWPVIHSLSPRLHSYWLKHYNLPGSYTRLAVESHDLEQTLNTLYDQGFCGANLTVPHKEAAMKIIDDLDAIARRVGAINTVTAKHGNRLEGFNTDVFGFRQNLQTGGFTRTDRPAVILGAGGAARAAIVALQDMQVTEIRLLNRTLHRAEQLADSLDGDIRAYEWGDAAALRDTELLVNATSLGLQGQPDIEIDLTELPPDATVTDMVYAPLMTGLLRQAQQRGNPIIDGLGMLLHQARPAFAAFFGRDPEVTPELRAHVLKPEAV